MKFIEPKRVNVKGYKYDDCAIVALGNALNISYDLARKILMNGVGIPNQNRIGISSRNKSKGELTDDITIIPILQVISESKVRLSSTLKTPADVRELPGVYICATDGHLLSVSEGKVLDTYDSSNETIEYIYKIDYTHGRIIAKDFANHFKMAIDEHIF